VRARVDRYYRIVATGFCFGVFGLLGLIVLCVVFPLAWFPGSESLTVRVRNKVLRRGMHWFSRVMAASGVLSYEVRHMERLERPGLLIVANHPSLVDVVFLIGLLRQPNCVVKRSLAENIFTRGPIRHGGFVVNSDGPGIVEDCIESVRAGDNLVIFPEGTRSLSHKGDLSPMKRGAANIALRGGINLTPVVITTTQPLLGKGMAWYQVPPCRPHFVLDVMDDIPVAPYLANATPAGEGDAGGVFNRAARALTRDLDTFFRREIERHELPTAHESGTSPAPCA